jgi:hypothetical protein
MKSPFLYGKIVEGKYFTNRDNEIARLSANFTNRINTILISPRRWGKSSLVKEANERFIKKNPKYKFCYIDLFNIRDENEFYSYYSKQLIKATAGKSEELLNSVKLFLKNISPKISFSADNISDFNISFDYKTIQQNFEEILNLPEKIAIKKNIEIIVCIDEFQNLSYFNDPQLFQKRLRASWQKQKRTSYCIYGSQTHMMMSLFDEKSMPFYRFGDIIYLKKIDKNKLSNFIIKAFYSTKKNISTELAVQITEKMECHPYYVQQLASLVWINTGKTVTKQIVEQSIDDLLTQNSPLYIKDAESLSNSQINFCEMLILGKNNIIYSSENINKYKLGTTGNISKIISALIKKEIIHKINGNFDFIDPAFKLWLNNTYFS